MNYLRNGFVFGCLILCLLSAEGVFADSLWTPGFEGYLSTKTAVQEGDIVLVQIDTSTSLSFDASASDAKNITFEFSGGEYGNLFSFLPATRTGGNQTARGKQEYTLNTEISARITEIDGTGKARIEGTRSFSLENKEELVSIIGWIDPGILGSERIVSFSQLADARLRFRTLLEPAGATLTAADIEEVIEIIQTQPAAAPGPEDAGQPPAGAPAAQPSVEERRSYQLTQEKKIELFLSYINRMVDLLFQ
jgi:flagellar basal body L-ring protein FlgH